MKEGDDLSNQQEAIDRMQLLLQQLKLTEDVYMSFFEQGQLQRLTVNKLKRQWHFVMELENILPYKLYQLMNTRFKEAFSHIAVVSIELKTRQPHVTEELIQDYWLAVIDQIDEMSPILKID